MSITAWARDSGNAAAVLPRGDRAYTVYSAEDGERLRRWHQGTVANIKKYAEPGAVIYFDWQFTDRISAIDHVGLIEKVLPDGRVQTIEGNTGDAVKRRVRSADVIAGFWNPPYDKSGPAERPAAKSWMEILMGKLPLVKPGARGNAAKTVFFLLKARGYAKDLDPKVIDPTVYSPPVVAEVKRLQGDHKLARDGEVGDNTWPVLVGV